MIYRRSKKYLGLLLREGILKENVDGEALKWAFKRLEYRYEKRKILYFYDEVYCFFKKRLYIPRSE